MVSDELLRNIAEQKTVSLSLTLAKEWQLLLTISHRVKFAVLAKNV